MKKWYDYLFNPWQLLACGLVIMVLNALFGAASLSSSIVAIFVCYVVCQMFQYVQDHKLTYYHPVPLAIYAIVAVAIFCSDYFLEHRTVDSAAVSAIIMTILTVVYTRYIVCAYNKNSKKPQ